MNDDANFPASSVLDFWLVQTAPGKWFVRSDELDAAIRLRFGDVTAGAIAGAYPHRDMTDREKLALIIVLDQFARNLYRGSADAFAGDSLALELARELIDRNADAGFSPEESTFLYLPLEHSENLANQELCVALFEKQGNENNIRYAVLHRDIIRRFGRFPHRNEVLGRESTAAELEFLKQPDSSF